MALQCASCPGSDLDHKGQAVWRAGLAGARSRLRLFAAQVRPLRANARAALEAAYCPGNGRPGVERVVPLGVSVLQFMERVPEPPGVPSVHFDRPSNVASVIFRRRCPV
jgi:hypothetical protein